MNCAWIFLCLFVIVVSAEEQFDDNSICYSNCIQNFNQTEFHEEICRKKCSPLSPEPDEAFDVLSTPHLYCLTTEAFSVAWQPWDESQHITYLIELRNRTLDLIAINTTTSTNFTYTDLEPETDYQVQVWGVRQPETEGGGILGPRLSPWVTTFDPYFIPPPVSDIKVDAIQVVDGKIEATVKWTPDKYYPSCSYNLVIFYGITYKEYEYRELSSPFEMHLDGLVFEKDVTITIHARNGDEESTKTEWFSPACLEVIGNLSFCAPAKPLGLSAEEVIVQVIPVKHQTYYDVTVRWDRPEHVPSYYRIVLSSSLINTLYLNVTVSGNSTQYIFKNVELGLTYMVALKAFSSGGESEPAMIQRHSTHTVAESSRFVSVIIIVGITAVSLLGLFGAGVWLFHRRAKRRRYERRCKYFEELDGKSPKTMDIISSGTGLILDECQQQEADKWDIPVDRLVLQSVLGEGAFGLVRRAWLRDDQGNASEVAVKMLKDAPSCDQMRQFMHEIEIMKTVGPHSHLVSLIGCCRPAPGQAGSTMLVVEFCALGDLQNYLRSAWERMTSPPDQPQLQYADLMSTNSEGSTNLIINKLYDIEAQICDNSLKPCDLLSFARQIAVGMEFLAGMKVLHRDLAARNVLVCVDKTVKIADFGLSRDVYKENMYRKSGNGKLPIRWMAIESLTHQIYTSQSDVWSFGILLWEIVTLGGNPYPSIPTNALLKYLKSGYRMERPTNCGPELYGVMLSCWKLRPKDRPNFTELRKSLDGLLESITTSKYLDLDVLTSTEFASFRVPFRDTSTLSGKSKSKGSDVLSSDRYVHPILLNNVKNSSGTTDIPIIIK